jgi:vacuolar-type H+-ATPase subunit C/Vma6
VLGAWACASVQARVRARRSRLLSRDAWRGLVDAPTLDRTLEMLRSTAYGVPEAAATPVATVPGAATLLQRSLRRELRRETVTLAASVPPRAQDLLTWLAERALVEDLKLLVRALHHGHTIDTVWPATTLVDRDDPMLAGLANVRGVTELVAALEGSPFGRALADASDHHPRQPQRAFYLEVALDLAYQRGLVARIDALSGADRKDAIELLGRALAHGNLIAAGRYRALSGVSPEEVVNFCLHRDFGGGLAMVQRVAAGGSLRDEAAALGIAPQAAEDDAATLVAIERASERQLRAAARDRFGRRPFGLGLVLAYLVEHRAEAQDLVTLVEAKAIGLDPDALRARVLREVA